MAECQRDWDAGQRHDLHTIADDHHALAIPAIYHRARREREEKAGQRATGGDDASLRGGVGDGRISSGSAGW